MKELGKLFTSSRFLGILAIAVLQALVLFNVLTGEQMEGLVLIIQGVIGSAVVVRTVDRGGDKNVEASKIESGMSPAKAKID